MSESICGIRESFGRFIEAVDRILPSAGIGIVARNSSLV